MVPFLAEHWLWLVIAGTVIVWFAAAACYIGPETWHHWQTRHWRWLNRQ